MWHFAIVDQKLWIIFQQQNQPANYQNYSTGITACCHEDKTKLKYITFGFKNLYSYENMFQLVLIGVKVTEN